ncbi:ribosome silencing factor [Synechococcus sp. C9]|jgi:ribosome-associated protein|uniref:ribosome silencing factor n=1 Tax=Synechococcus sp. C9 TaxID=102119 RepID=UPI001FF4E591|nr:ribosome silencing factor [Synechococcus sp. C9]WAS06464.1 ribosome silencing factor [Gloeomargaritales cyanobacterium VI4D9]
MTRFEQPDPTTQLALTIAQAADERKGRDILLLRVTELSYLADYFVLVTGYSSAQVRAIARGIQDQVAQQWHTQPRHQEGSAEGGWVLQDYGDVIVHIFLPKEREFYDLERFWAHAERLAFSPVG